MRISALQSDVLFVLYALEKSGVTEPIDNMKLLGIVNKSRSYQVADTNFRTSCHKLAEHGMLRAFRCNQSMALSWSLSDEGRAKAKEVTNKRAVNDVEG